MHETLLSSLLPPFSSKYIVTAPSCPLPCTIRVICLPIPPNNHIQPTTDTFSPSSWKPFLPLRLLPIYHLFHIFLLLLLDLPLPLPVRLLRFIALDFPSSRLRLPSFRTLP